MTLPLLPAEGDRVLHLPTRRPGTIAATRPSLCGGEVQHFGLFADAQHERDGVWALAGALEVVEPVQRDLFGRAM